MKSIIIYKSKYGATHQYAVWISKKLLIPFTTPDRLTDWQIKGYDEIFLGSSVYIGKLMIAKWLKKNKDLLAGKKLVLFIVCATPSDETEKLQTIAKENVPEELLADMSVYFLHGRVIKKNLSMLDRFALFMGALFAKKKDAKAMLTDFDDVKQENLEQLLDDLSDKPIKKKAPYLSVC